VTEVSNAVLPKRLFVSRRDKSPAIRVAPVLLELAGLEVPDIHARLASRAEGLTAAEAQARLAQYGPNVLAKDHRAGIARLLWRSIVNPLVILLAALATISFATADVRAGLLMLSMIVLSVGLKLVQEAKASGAAAKLKAMISVTATVLRDGTSQEIPVAQLVPGDVVQLNAGDMVPGDVRIVQAKDLFVSQGALTGESFPVEKCEVEKNAAQAATAPITLTSIAFLGTSVESGTAIAVVAATGRNTYLGSMAASLQEPQAPTAFDRGIARFTWLMLRFMLVMVPLVFVINGLTKGNWIQAFPVVGRRERPTLLRIHTAARSWNRSV
jgi:P-type Mg2+ transporter